MPVYFSCTLSFIYLTSQEAVNSTGSFAITEGQDVAGSLRYKRQFSVSMVDFRNFAMNAITLTDI